MSLLICEQVIKLRGASSFSAQRASSRALLIGGGKREQGWEPLSEEDLDDDGARGSRKTSASCPAPAGQAQRADLAPLAALRRHASPATANAADKSPAAAAPAAAGSPADKSPAAAGGSVRAATACSSHLAPAPAPVGGAPPKPIESIPGDPLRGGTAAAAAPKPATPPGSSLRAGTGWFGMPSVSFPSGSPNASGTSRGQAAPSSKRRGSNGSKRAAKNYDASDGNAPVDATQLPRAVDNVPRAPSTADGLAPTAPTPAAPASAAPAPAESVLA